MCLVLGETILSFDGEGAEKMPACVVTATRGRKPSAAHLEQFHSPLSTPLIQVQKENITDAA